MKKNMISYPIHEFFERFIKQSKILGIELSELDKVHLRRAYSTWTESCPIHLVKLNGHKTALQISIKSNNRSTQFRETFA